MDQEVSSEVNTRKRTESNGGGSDSELSEGWNVIDSMDVNPDAPSSDGESVEVIEADDESRENGTDTELEGNVQEGEGQLAPCVETPVVPATVGVEAQADVAPRDSTNPIEEMFDSSFCWFLFFATAAVLVSNLTFMIAENTIGWNTDVNIEAPSFLRDLPTPKLQQGENIPWAEKEEIEIINKKTAGKYLDKRYVDMYENRELNKKYLKNTNRKWQKEPFKSERQKEYFKSDKQRQHFESSEKRENRKYNNQKEFFKSNEEKENFMYEKQKDSFHSDNYEIGKYFKVLSDISHSSETQQRFDQALLILDALYIGLNDLEDIVTENSELHSVLRKQKYKLSEVLTELEYGVSKSMDRLAINILHKVQKMERRFENQWCELEKQGHREELKGLFYDCQENEDTVQGKDIIDNEQSEKTHEKIDLEELNSEENIGWRFQYQSDKDSPGKEYAEKYDGKSKEEDGYHDFVDTEKWNSDKYSEHSNSEDIKTHEFSEKYVEEKNEDKRKYHPSDERKIFENKKHYYDEKRKYSDGKGKYYDENKKYFDEKRKHSNDHRKHIDDKRKKYNENNNYYEHTVPHNDYKSKEERYYKDDIDNKVKQVKSEKGPKYETDPEFVKKYLKENCDKNKLSGKFSKIKNIYEKLKSFIDSKLRVPRKMFDSLFNKYCKTSDESFKWQKHINKEHLKGDFSGKNKNIPKEEVITGDRSDNDQIRIIDITTINDPQQKMSDETIDVILPNEKSKQWILSLDESLYENESNLTGDWFFRAGESRSKVRWSHHRGDWWFERASHRRNNPQPPNWFTGKHKNWFFRRAWAREQCRQSPHDSWCHLSDDDETITIPDSKYR